jgi:hypothetical protein
MLKKYWDSRSRTTQQPPRMRLPHEHCHLARPRRALRGSACEWQHGGSYPYYSSVRWLYQDTVQLLPGHPYDRPLSFISHMGL